jgi:putative DNA primase/helicase
MVGVVEHVEHGVIGASKTYLAIDGSQKAAFHDPRLFVGLVGGGAVRLGMPDDSRELVVGEGIESTLSYMQMHALPGWAALSAAGIARLALPLEARRVVIAADNDRNGIGLKGALAAARRWGGEMRRVRIDMPQDAGTDWNDVLVGRAMVPA